MTDFDRKEEAKRAANRERQRRYRQQRKDLLAENRRLQAELARLRGTDHHQPASEHA